MTLITAIHTYISAENDNHNICFQGKLQILPKIGQNSLKSVIIAKKRSKLMKIGLNQRKLVKIAEIEIRQINQDLVAEVVGGSRVVEQHHLLLHVQVAAFLQPGTDVMIFKIFSPKNLAKKLAFLAHKAKF
jgi:hypothetical protein